MLHADNIEPKPLRNNNPATNKMMPVKNINVPKRSSKYTLINSFMPNTHDTCMNY